MKVSDHNQLAELERDATKLADSLQSELGKHRQKLSQLRGEEAQKRYTPAHLREQVDAERKRAREIAAQHAAGLDEIKRRIESAATAWSTEAKLREARLVEGDSIEHQILGELRHARLAQEFRDATPAQLIEHIGEAGQHSDLARLELLRREIARRKFPSEVERIPLASAFDQAIESIEIPGQQQAIAVIEAAAEKLSIASDSAAELRTGKEAIGTQMRRAVEKHFGTGEGEQTA